MCHPINNRRHLFMVSTFPRSYCYTPKQKEVKLSVLPFFFSHCGFLSAAGGNRGVDARLQNADCQKFCSPEELLGCVLQDSPFLLGALPLPELPLRLSSTSKASFLFFFPCQVSSMSSLFSNTCVHCLSFFSVFPSVSRPPSSLSRTCRSTT